MSAITSRSANTNGDYIPYQIDFVAKSVGKQVKSSKRRLRWKFGFANLPAVKAGLAGTECRASEHEVELIWSVSSGKVQILCDDEEVDFEIFPPGDARRHIDKTVTLPRPDDKAGGGFRKIRVIAHAIRHNGDTFPQYNLKIDGRDFDKFPTIFELGSESARVKFANILKNVEMPGETSAAPEPLPPKLAKTEDKNNVAVPQVDEGHRAHETVQEENLLMKSLGEGTPGVTNDAAIASSASPSVYASELASLSAPTSPSEKVLSPNSFAVQNTPAPTDSGVRVPPSPSYEVSSPDTFTIQNTPVPIGSGTLPPGALTPPGNPASPTTTAVNITENKDNPFKAYVEPNNPAANEKTHTEKKSSFVTAFEQMVNLDDINQEPEHSGTASAISTDAQNKGGIHHSRGLQPTEVGNAWAGLQQPTLEEMRTAKQG